MQIEIKDTIGNFSVTSVLDVPENFDPEVYRKDWNKRFFSTFSSYLIYRFGFMDFNIRLENKKW